MHNVVEDKSFQFAVRIVRLSRYLQTQQKELIISKQMLRSGTSIGANVAEAQQAQSRADFISKMNIALKECVETDYWLRLLRATNYLSEEDFRGISYDCIEIKKILVSIVRTSKNQIQ